MARKTKDVEKMTEGQLLRELVDRFMEFDRATDRHVCILQDALSSCGADVMGLKGVGRAMLAADNAWCRCREICRIVKDDPLLLMC